MTTARKATGIAIAAAAASMFAMATLPAVQAQSAEVKCFGANECKGHSDCNTAKSAKGQNACKGQGFKVMSEKACKEAKGKVVKMKS
jgi:hypothetical protein